LLPEVQKRKKSSSVKPTVKAFVVVGVTVGEHLSIGRLLESRVETV